MKKILFTLFLIPTLIFGQFNPKHIDDFQHKTIIIRNDTISYHIYSNGNVETKSKILVFFQGSGPKPLFQKGVIIDTLKTKDNWEEKVELKKTPWFGSSVPLDLQKIPNDYLFVVISKKGVPFLDIDEKFKPNDLYYKNEGLNYRVWQGDKVINEITKKVIKKTEKVVILGHSEGSDVVAKLGHTNKKVTHIGYWAGGANIQYYEFALMIQKSVLKGELSQEEAINQLDSLFLEIKNIQKEPNSIQKQWWGNSYKRWTEFSEPPIENLLKINRPLFVAVATSDNSVPFEASLLIPIEFQRYQKSNLTFKMYTGLDHKFSIKPKDEKRKSKFNDIFEEFMKWVEQQ